ncbi:response regulator transcription factor [Deinococcus pimensis]|uniref:response regulator transcription factor n=1 Tax=Deinococcus pimensis TaxID=309888 RepID=UPI0004B421FD|nr:response regulator transcription factor [Deinococcus pimensis]
MTTPTILIVEDDPDIARLLDLTLRDARYHTLTAQTATSGLVLARQHTPDLVLVDLGLPDFAGDEVARRLRATHDLPILILTAVDDVDRKVNLFAAGANDYVTKPFHPDELLARIHVQFRHRVGKRLVDVGALRLDVDARLCTYREREVPLSPREFDLLCLLARTPGRVLTRPEIARALWGAGVVVADNVIDVHLSNVRGKLRRQGGYGLIRTARGVGFAVRSPAEPTGSALAAPGAA